jgi:hypothetical protein
LFTISVTETKMKATYVISMKLRSMLWCMVRLSNQVYSCSVVEPLFLCNPPPPARRRNYSNINQVSFIIPAHPIIHHISYRHKTPAPRPLTTTSKNRLPLPPRTDITKSRTV